MSTPIDAGAVRLRRDGAVAHLLFDRPAARNAMTWAMYEQLAMHCRALAADAGVRALLMRGAGGEAFVAGTDIAQFRSFGSGTAGADAGVAYEAQIDAGIALIEALRMPTVALVEGWCVGGGLAIASACDFRLATPNARFAVPIARTLGNCLSVANLARLQARWGEPRLRRMLLLSEAVTADDALACGAVLALHAAKDLGPAGDALAARLAALAPLTQQVSKEGLRRLTQAALPEGEDLVRLAYGSADFQEGVSAFVAKRGPVWRGV